MPVTTDKYLLSEGNSLLKIKREQFKHQIPPLVLLLIAFLINIILPGMDLFTPSLVIAILAVAWYLLIGAGFRFRQRIPIPPEGSMVSPLQGRVAYIRSNDDITLINVKKTYLDSAELRSPHNNCRIEGGVVTLDSEAGKVSFRFNIRKLRYFDDPDFRTGNIIGLLYGIGSCTITLPRELKLGIKTGDAIDAGEPILASLKAETAPPAGIVLDEVGEIGNDE